MPSGRPTADVIDDEAMADFCAETQKRYAQCGMELFDRIGLDDVHAAFALATEDRCFLVDRVRGSRLRDYRELHLAAAKLAALEPKTRIYGILLADAPPPDEFRDFGLRHGIVMGGRDAASRFVEEKLAAET